MLMKLVPAALAATTVAASASAAVVYTENFDSATEVPAGYSSGDNFGNFFEPSGDEQVNGSAGLYLDAGFGANAFVFFNSAETDAPILVNAGDTVALTVELNFAGTGGDYTTANDPNFVPVPVRLDVAGDDGTFDLGFASQEFSENGTYTVSGTATSSGSFAFGIDIPTGAGDAGVYGQVEVDTISVDVTPVPEPASIALLGLGAAALLRRGR